MGLAQTSPPAGHLHSRACHAQNLRAQKDLALQLSAFFFLTRRRYQLQVLGEAKLHSSRIHAQLWPALALACFDSKLFRQTRQGEGSRRAGSTPFSSQLRLPIIVQRLVRKAAHYIGRRGRRSSNQGPSSKRRPRFFLHLELWTP